MPPDRTPASAADQVAFEARVAPYRRELHVHCYRMLGSFDEAEDLVQETLLRAWRARDSFGGEQLFRAWLYRIATNACLDALRRSKRQLTVLGSFAEVSWLQPYPDRLLDELAPPEEQPDAVLAARETIALAFLAVVQLLPPRQRAVLILRDVLEWSAADTAACLEMSVPAANSALQRARATLQERAPGTDAWAERATAPTPEESELLARFIDAHERHDMAASIAMLREDIRVTMPPFVMVYDGLDAIRGLMATAFSMSDVGAWRLVPTRANRMPTAASYFRDEDGVYRAFKLDVLRIEGGAIAEITTFGPALFPQFGLPETLGA